MNIIRCIALGAVLVAGGVLAEEEEGNHVHRSPSDGPPGSHKPVKSFLTKADAPKNCEDQCTLMEKMMSESFKKGSGSKNKNAVNHGKETAKKMADACRGSCEKYGKIDKQYMMEHLKPPPGFKGKGGGDSDKSSSGKSGKEDGDAN